MNSSNEISKLFFKNKLSTNDNKKQVSIWADTETNAILETYNNIHGESKTNFIKRAIKKLAIEENENWFEDE